MPVNKQLVPVQFGGGINTKVDPKQLQPGELLDLQNGQFTKQGEIVKRAGYDILNRTIEGGGTITAGVELANYKNELVLFDGNNVFTYLPVTGNWSNRGTAISVTTEDKTIIKTSAAQQLNPDMAYLNGIEVFAWEDSRGGVRYSTMDTETKAFALSDSLLSITGQQPKVIAFQTQIFIFYTGGESQIFYQTVNPYNPTVVTPAVAVVTDGFDGLNGFPYDVTVIGNQMFIGYLSASPTTGSIRLFYLDALLNKSDTVDIETLGGRAINGGYHGAINVVGDSSNNCWISWSNGVAVRVARNTYANINTLASTVVDAVDCRTLTGIQSPDGTSLLLHYEVYNATSYKTQVRYVNIATDGTFAAAMTIRSVGLASKAWTYQDNIYVNTAYESATQSTDFTFLIAQQGELLTTPVIIAKETPGVGGGLISNGMLPELSVLDDGVFKFANLHSGKLISEANTLFSLLGVNSTKLIYAPSNNFINTVQSNTLLIIGGILQGYDGVSVTELGFHLYPEDITATPAGADGSLSTGTYLYQVVFEWTDNNGQIYRSAPSTPVTANVTAGNHVTLSGPTLRLTAKGGTRGAPSIVIYRTSANGLVYNRVSSTLAPLLNDKTVDTWTFVDLMSDVAASSNELLYTTGDVLENIAPPASSIIITYSNRVFLAGLSDKLEMWFSQSVVNNTNANTIPPQFNDSLTFGCDPLGGDITAFGLVNQELIIFKESKIFSLHGNGPDATGQNSDYGDPTLITSDVGCTNQNSVVIVPNGIMFQSIKGIFQLDQSLNLTYIGAPVEAYNGYTITSAICDPNTTQVVFTTLEGVALVYNYFFKQWSTWTNHFAKDTVIYNNVLTYVKPDGHVYVQNQSKFTDGSVPIFMLWTLPNLSFAGIQGYQRVFRCYILGTYKGPHTLRVKVAYDYNSVYTQEAVVTPSPNITTWGSDTTWGSGSSWGGDYEIYEFRIDFEVQKCTSIRIQVSDNQTSNYNEGYSISSVVFEVGALPGGNRLAKTNTYGAQ